MSATWKLIVTLLIAVLNKILSELDCPHSEPDANPPHGPNP